MVVGILVGTYSTVYIAAPLVVWWTERITQKRQQPPAARRPSEGDRRHTARAYKLLNP